MKLINILSDLATILSLITLLMQYDQDIAGPIENAMEDVDADYNCNAFLCRGYQYEDNVDNVKEVKAGDLLDFHIDLIAGHHPGYAVISFPAFENE